MTGFLHFLMANRDHICFRFLREEDADVLRIRRGSLSPEPENKEKWLKMSYETEKSCLLAPQESQTPYGCLTANEKYEIPGMGEDSVLEMLSYSKFSDLETWLCMPSTLLPRSRDSVCSMLPPSHENDNGETYKETRPPENESSHLSQCQERKTHLLPPSPLLPVSASPHSSSPLQTTSTPLPKPTRDSCHGGVSVRKRRRLAASPGGLHWDASGSVLRDHDRGETSSLSEVKRFPRTVNLESRVPELWRDREALRKTISVDDRLLQQTPSEHHRLLSRLERGKKKLRNINSLGATGRYETHKKSESRISRLAQRLNQRQSDAALIKDFRPLFLLSGSPGSSQSLDRNFSMTQQMQNLQLTQSKKGAGPASPSAAKRLYRNLSEKFKGSHSSFEDAYFFGRSDRIRKVSNIQSSEALFEAVEQQDLDAVQILLFQYTADELDLNTPNSEGLTPLDISIMTNNVPIAKLLLKAGGKESPHFVSLDSRDAHLSALVQEAQRRASELSTQVMRESLSLETSDKEKQLKAWEWRCKLYKRMRTGFEHARPPEAPLTVRLSVTGSTSLTVSFQEPASMNSAVVTKYKVEWSCLKDFSLLAGELILENLQSLKYTITGLTTGRQYYVQVSAYNMKGWGPAQLSQPPSAVPSNWKDCDGRECRRRGHIEAMERLLQQVRATHQHYCCGDTSKLQNPSRKQSVSRSLKHLFHSSTKFVKTLKRGVYIASVFYHKDSLLVTNEDQIPIVEVDDSYSSSLMQDFLWFTKLSCMWEDVRWLRQSLAVSTSSSSTLQSRQKMLAAAGQLQNLLGTHNLGRVHYEPIKDRHGNVLLVTVREMDSFYSFFNGKWMQVSKLQSQRKSLSTPEEPYALDILLITIQDILAYQRRSQHRLSSGLYLGYLKLSSSVDQIKVLVPQRMPNMLCHTKIRDNWNVSRDEWEWLQSLSGPVEVERADQATDCLLFSELQMAIKSLLHHINLPLHQAKHFRLYTHEVLELGHNVSFLLLLPASDDVCSAPGQTNPYTPHSGFLNLPLQMFELVHFCSYKEKFISLYCRLSSVLDLDGLITQQAFREAITDSEVSTAKQRQQHILDYIQQLDEMWRDVRWITNALQYARYKQPLGWVPIIWLVDVSVEPPVQKNDSTSSNTDYVPTPSPSPEMRRRKPTIGKCYFSIAAIHPESQPGSDEEGCSEVFLPTDSDYDSSDALSPRDLDLVYSSAQDLSHQAVHVLSGSAPDVLQMHDLKYSACSKSILETESCTKDMEDLSLSSYSVKATDKPSRCKFLADPPTKRKMLSKSHPQRSYFGGPHRWLRVQSESHTPSLSEGIYTRQSDMDLPLETPLSPTNSYSLDEYRATYRESKPNVRRIFVESCSKTSPCRDAPHWEEEEKGSRGAAAGETGSGYGTTAEAHDVDSDELTNEQVSEILSSTL
ncbi:ankyrin repeat and fibronectin type-III domain-containing protein 1 isoform X2 [Ctenopharyngodon idella]|uniref:ankyrin repeat and fibronectin type-III domain-containing protein 1 isoform X2 n=1 Tax=Ctenopharyngodon idella TaxID=7959 RepID=UPI0022305810|nr:ankyrin repeat and fibronectin type-III domain-containing protein 1 isoform X2 [Ctenopharyngodon idella]